MPVVYSLNTEFQLCNNEKVFLMDPNTSDMSLAEMDYKGAFSKGELLSSCSKWLRLESQSPDGMQSLFMSQSASSVGNIPGFRSGAAKIEAR